MARKKKQNPAQSAPPLQKAPEDDTQPTRRITRSMESKIESANTSTSALSSAGVASGAGAPSNNSTATAPPQKSNKLPPNLFVIKNTTYNLPTDPVLLNPAVDNEPWEARVSRFKSIIDRVNPNANTPARSLAALFNRYLKVSAWAGQKGRSQKLTEAREAFERVRKSGGLNQIMNSSKPAKSQGSNQHSAAELSKDDWVYPEQPTLLAPESEGESLQDRLKRLCTAILVANAAGKDEMTPTTLETVMSRWISKNAFRFTPDGKTLRQNVLQEVDELRRSAAYREVIDKSLADFSASDPASATHESNAGSGPHSDLEETDGECDKPPGPPNDKLNLGKEDAESALDNSALVSGHNEATGHSKDPGVTKPGPAPTASEWASLLETGPEVGAVKSDAEADMALEQGGEPADAVLEGYPTRIVMSEQQALEEQRSYYPATSASSSVCVVCGSSGHVFSACPGTICKHCMGDHFAWACPQRGRCAKCKQFGHKAAACPEKLAMVMEEGLECAFCSSHTHLERDCDVVWRSFHPRPEDIRTVRQINAACAICGSVSHFSSDCGLFGDRRFNATWSLANRNQYVDESSEQHAIAALSEVPEPAKFGPQIKGVPAKRTHVFYSDSDGSEEGEFFGSKVQPKAGPGQIRMATNIQFNSITTNTQAQPPLPPGPPPPGPPPKAGGYSSLSRRGGAHSLPPRPPAPGQASFGQPHTGMRMAPPPGLGGNGSGQPGNDLKRPHGAGDGQVTRKRPRYRRGGKHN